LAICFGVSPIAWANDDMPELGGDTPLETILGDAHEIGFAGIELGGTFPRDPGVLRPLLDRYDLSLIGGWFSGNLLAHDVDAEVAAAADHLALLKAMGSTVWVHAETSNAVHGQRGTPLSQTPRLTDAECAAFGRRMTDFADYIRGQGMRMAYHHHLGTVIERPDHLDAFIRATGESVGLTIDTGHAALGGIDPVATIRAHPRRIAHIHCKDVRAPVFSALKERGGSFLDGVLAGMFTTPGDGSLDYAAVMRSLADIGYSGWIVVEAEQDPAIADPRHYGALGLATLRREAVGAGLREAV
jgi:inosose dehydratase